MMRGFPQDRKSGPKRAGMTLAALLACGLPALGGEIPQPLNVPQAPRTWKPNWFVEDEFIVLFTREVRPQIQPGIGPNRRPISGVPAIDSALESIRAEKLEPLFPGAKPQPITSRIPDLTGHFRVKIPHGANLEAALQTMKNNPKVEMVEKIGIHAVSATPNDPSYPTQWHYYNEASVFAADAWDNETGDPAVIVAVADTGVRYFHWDLGGPNPVWTPAAPINNGNIFINTNEIPADGIDNDMNGRIDDTVGYDFVESTSGTGCTCIDVDCGTLDNDPDDYDGHGTHVAGTIAAMNNNNRMVAGVAGGWSDGTVLGAGNGVRILPLRIGWEADCTAIDGPITGLIRMDYAASALYYSSVMVERGHNVTAFNCSWGSSDSGGLSGAITTALAHDILIVKAAGNDAVDDPDYMGSRTGIMNVAATTISGGPASFTNFGPWVDLAAPGNNVLSTWRNPSDNNPANHYTATLSGTSMAAPHVCGVAALLESCKPELTGPEKFDLLVARTRPYSGSLDLGSGIVNAYDAMRAVGCAPCLFDSDCDDGLYCNGAEFCDAGVCTSSPAIDCDDQIACTFDACDEDDDACVNIVQPLIYSANVNQIIPDNGGFVSQLTHTISIPDSITIDDVDIMLDIDHGFQGNLRATITHNGTTRTLMSRPGPGSFGCGQDNFQNVVLDDEGTGGTIEAQCVTDLTSPPNYVPDELLGAFDGMSAAGDWTITVSDHQVSNQGTLVSWAVHIRNNALQPELCGAPDAIAADGGPIRNRFISLAIPTSAGPAAPTAIRVRLSSLHHPSAPANPPDFTAFEGQYRYVNTYRDGSNNPVFSCTDSPSLGTFFQCAKLGCEPEYRDWSGELGGQVLHVTGRDVIPSSIYHVAHLAQPCEGQETTCPAASLELEVTTARWGDVNPGVLNAFDIASVVDKAKDLPFAISKTSGLLQPHVPNPQGVFSAANVAAVVDAVKAFPYNASWAPETCP